MLKTSNILSQMKSIRMMGIESQVADFVQRLREVEIAECKKLSTFHAAVYGFSKDISLSTVHQQWSISF